MQHVLTKLIIRKFVKSKCFQGNTKMEITDKIKKIAL